jgi:hypothetical protein
VAQVATTFSEMAIMAKLVMAGIMESLAALAALAAKGRREDLVSIPIITHLAGAAWVGG